MNIGYDNLKILSGFEALYNNKFSMILKSAVRKKKIYFVFFLIIFFFVINFIIWVHCLLVFLCLDLDMYNILINLGTGNCCAPSDKHLYSTPPSSRIK